MHRLVFAFAFALAACTAPPAPRSAPPAPGGGAWATFGTSVEGRPLRVRTLGRGPRRVLWIGGIHGDEAEGAVATAELATAFLIDPDLSRRLTLTIVEDLNPDGRAAGTRGNARGVDLNRNYPARNYRPGEGRGERALSEPESTALFGLLDDPAPELVFVMHSWRRGDSINWDGPGRGHAERFARESGFELVASESIHGTPGSLGSLVGVDRGVPILTVEFARGSDPRRCWLAVRGAVLSVLRAVAAP